jgi:hypothetical protein
MDLQANTDQVVAFIDRVADNPSTACKRCRKWFNNIGLRRRGVCQAYKAQTFETDFCLKEFQEK